MEKTIKLLKKQESILEKKIATLENEINELKLTSNEEASRVRFMVWDIIPLICFQEGVWNKEYSGRLELLSQKLKDANAKKITLIHSQEVSDFDSVFAIFNEFLASGEEGIILKDPNGLWENKRSKGLIKFKAELTMEMRVVEVVEGTGKYIGKVGSLQCQTDDGLITSGVGTGLNDEDRERPFDYYIGKIITVKYNEIIQDSKGNKSLFLPVYEEVRFDKDTTD